MIFWNILSSTLTTNTGLAINTLTANKACLLKKKAEETSNIRIQIENTIYEISNNKKVTLKK